MIMFVVHGFILIYRKVWIGGFIRAVFVSANWGCRCPSSCGLFHHISNVVFFATNASWISIWTSDSENNNHPATFYLGIYIMFAAMLGVVVRTKYEVWLVDTLQLVMIADDARLSIEG